MLLDSCISYIGDGPLQACSMLNKFSDAILALFSYLLTFLAAAAAYPVPVYTTPVPMLPADYDVNNTTVSKKYNTLLGSYVSSLI